MFIIHLISSCDNPELLNSAESSTLAKDSISQQDSINAWEVDTTEYHSHTVPNKH